MPIPRDRYRREWSVALRVLQKDGDELSEDDQEDIAELLRAIGWKCFAPERYKPECMELLCTNLVELHRSDRNKLGMPQSLVTRLRTGLNHIRSDRQKMRYTLGIQFVWQIILEDRWIFDSMPAVGKGVHNAFITAVEEATGVPYADLNKDHPLIAEARRRTLGDKAE